MITELLGSAQDKMKDYLEQITRLRRDHIPKGWKWPCIEAMVRSEGMGFSSMETEVPEHLRGPMGQCFQNAWKAVVLSEHELTYCEGYAWGIIPALHAWVMRPDGVILDPTWAGQVAATSYYGVPLKYHFVLKFRQKNRSISILDAWEDGMPMLRGKCRGYLANVPETASRR